MSAIVVQVLEGIAVVPKILADAVGLVVAREAPLSLHGLLAKENELVLLVDDVSRTARRVAKEVA